MLYGRPHWGAFRRDIKMKEIPDYQTLMLPVLKSVADGKEHKIKEITESLSKEFSLTEEELNIMIPSGTQSVFYNDEDSNIWLYGQIINCLGDETPSPIKEKRKTVFSGFVLTKRHLFKFIRKYNKDKKES